MEIQDLSTISTALTILALALASCAPAEIDSEAPTEDSDVEITPFVGAGVQLEYEGTVIPVDPWSRVD